MKSSAHIAALTNWNSPEHQSLIRKSLMNDLLDTGSVKLYSTNDAHDRAQEAIRELQNTFKKATEKP